MYFEYAGARALGLGLHFVLRYILFSSQRARTIFIAAQSLQNILYLLLQATHCTNVLCVPTYTLLVVPEAT